MGKILNTMKQVIYKDDALLRCRGGIIKHLIHVRYLGLKKLKKASEGREVL